MLRGLVVPPEDGLAAPFIAIVVAIALSIAPSIKTFLHLTFHKDIHPSNLP